MKKQVKETRYCTRCRGFAIDIIRYDQGTFFDFAHSIKLPDGSSYCDGEGFASMQEALNAAYEAIGAAIGMQVN